MRPRLVHFICRAILPLVVAGACAAQTSEKMRAQIMAALPKYTPPTAAPAAAAAVPVGTPAPLSDDPVVRLPNFEVTTRRQPATDPDSWLSKQAIQEKAYKEYKDSMTPLDWALNCIYIPIVTPSPQARADAAYAEKRFAAEMNQISKLVDVISRVDPADAKRLEREMDFDRHPDN